MEISPYKAGLHLLFIIISSFFSTAYAQSWEQVDSSTVRNLKDVWAAASASQTPSGISLKVFGVGENGVIISSANGTTWTEQSSGTPNELNGIWGGSSTNVYAVGNNYTVLHYDGNSWSAVNTGTQEIFHLFDIWGYTSGSAIRVYAVGELGTILSFNGTQWVRTTIGDFDLRAVWGSSFNNVFAVGAEGKIFRFDGETWKSQASGTNKTLTAIWGSSSLDVYAVGENGTILHYDGEAWSNQSTTASYDLTEVWGTSPCNIYASGSLSGPGAVLRFDGSSWTSQTNLFITNPAGSPSPALNSVHGASLRNIFAVGSAGFVMSYNVQGSGSPAVCSVQPASAAGSVLRDTSIYATFNAVMDTSTINSSTFTVSNGSGSVAGTVTYSNNIARFTPSQSLAESTTYTASLSGSVKDTLGVSLGSDYVWTFTTGSGSTSDSGGSGSCFISTSRKKAVRVKPASRSVTGK